MMTKVNLKKNVRVHVTRRDIEEGKCTDPNKCMIKLAVARAINIPHGYIRVDSTGVSITRRNDYREKAFMPRTAVVNMFRFDNKQQIEPFYFVLKFVKTTRVHKATAERREKVNQARARRKAEGRPDRQYSLAKRLRGVAVTAEMAAEIGLK